MSETPQDPAGTTHQFQHFAAQAPAEKPKKVNTGLVVGVVLVVALLVIAAIAIGMMI